MSPEYDVRVALYDGVISLDSTVIADDDVGAKILAEELSRSMGNTAEVAEIRQEDRQVYPVITDDKKHKEPTNN